MSTKLWEAGWSGRDHPLAPGVPRRCRSVKVDRHHLVRAERQRKPQRASHFGDCGKTGRPLLGSGLVRSGPWRGAEDGWHEGRNGSS